MRILKLILVVAVLFAALLVFPNRIPEFAGLWLAWCSARLVTGNSIYFELLAIPVWLALKWPEPTLALGLFVVASVFVFIKYSHVENARGSLPILWTTWLIWIVHHHGIPVSDAFSNQHGPIVCLGDSLTDYGFPQHLEKLVSTPIADYGFNGYDTNHGVGLINEIAALNPNSVIIELGGHDYNSNSSRESTEMNFRQMIEAFQECGAIVILVEIPRGFINDPWYGLERQLAREYGLRLIPDTMIRRLVYWSPFVPPGMLCSHSQHLSNDGLHPNTSGNQMMAEVVAGYVNRSLPVVK